MADRFSSEVKWKEQPEAGKLSEQGTKGCTADSKTKAFEYQVASKKRQFAEDKKRIQYHIQNATGGEGDHTKKSLAFCA